MSRIEFDSYFKQPLSEIFAMLSDHEEFGRVTGANMTRTKPGDDGELNGVGSLRDVKIGPLPAFEEKVVAFEKDSLIQYTITQGSPIKNHMGWIRFQEYNGGTHVNYVIEFEPKVPLTGGLIGFALKQGIHGGFKKFIKKTA